MAHTQLQNMLLRRSLRLALTLALASIVGWALVSNNSFLTRRAQAAGFVVTNTNDSGAGSLRQAILNANGNGLDSPCRWLLIQAHTPDAFLPKRCHFACLHPPPGTASPTS